MNFEKIENEIIRMVRLQKYKLYEFMVALCVFINGLGFVIPIAGINIVHILSLLTFILILINVLQKRTNINRFFQDEKKWFLFFFSIWITYAFIQLKLMPISIEYFKVGIMQLITNSIFIFFVLYTVHDEKSLSLIEKAIVGVLFVNVALGTFEIFTNIHFVEASSIWDVNHTRAFSDNVNEYATTVYCSLMGLAVMATHKKRLGKILKCLAILSGLCILTSTSRGITLAVFVYILNYYMMKIYLDKVNGKTIFLKLILLSGLFILGVLVVFGMISSIANWMVKMFSGQGNIVSDNYRLYLILEGLSYFKQSYGLGVGAGQSIHLVKMNIHNFLIEILVEYGIVIFIGLIWILWSVWNVAFLPFVPSKVRCIYFSFIPSAMIAGISSSNMNKFKIFWVILLLFYLSKSILYKKISGASQI